MFNDPEFKIVFPDDIKEVNLKNSNILLDNGLEIENAKVTKENGKNVINLNLKGKQTEYSLNSDYKGAIVVLNTDLTLDTLTPTGNSNITMKYVNNNENSTKNENTLEEQINFIAPNGVVAASGISNYKENAEDILSIADEAKTVEIDTYSPKRIATVNGIIINNYENSIGEISILGRLPSEGNKKIDSEEEMGSTFTIPLNTGLALTGVESTEYKIYYSDNANATKDLNNASNNWKEEATTNSKSFLIVFADEYKMEKGTRIDFTYNITIPENIDPNNETYGMYKIYYNNESKIGSMPESKESAVIGIKTQEGPQLLAEISSNIDTVKEGQIVKMTATVSNIGNQVANNVKVKIPVPDYGAFVDFRVGSTFTVIKENGENIKEQTLELGTINPKEEKQVSYYIKFDDYAIKGVTEDMTEEEITADQTFPKEIVHQLEIITDDLKNPIPSSKYIMNLDDASMKISLISNIEDDRVLNNGDEINFSIKVTNIADTEELTNTIVALQIPQGLEYVEASIEGDEDSQNVVFDEETNVLQLKLGTLEGVKDIDLKLRATDYEGSIRMVAIAKADDSEEHYSNVFEHNAESLKIEISELTSTPKYVKETENITYKFTVTNSGSAIAKDVNIIDEIPEGLELVEAVYKYNDGDDIKVTRLERGRLVITLNQMDPKSKVEVTIIAKADYLQDKNDKEVRNRITVQAKNIEDITSNEVVNIVEYNSEVTRPNDNNTPSDPGQTENRYKITGTAWIDNNKDGKRDSGEATLDGVQVYLLNQNMNMIIKDPDTNENKITTTSNDGKYEFNNLVPGQYVVIFVYDSSKYSLTQYQAQGIDTSENSDAIDINITLDGERRIAAITDVIEITNSNARDIDLGICEAEKFDLRIDKYISKVTLSTPTIGTRVDEHNNLEVAKVEVLGQNLGKSTAVVEYTIKVTNEGSVSGYVRNIVDYLPDELSFSTELNPDWYLSDNGNIYNSSLENIKLEPGDSQEIKLIVSVNITEDTLGIISNNVELYETYNEQGLQDIDSEEANQDTNEDDMSKADLVVSLVTGKIISYTIITFVVIAILGVGIFEIKKHVLTKKV